ncbi:MAG: hypothetical protein R2749_26635 [Acidimicrobiales bacterium]
MRTRIPAWQHVPRLLRGGLLVAVATGEQRAGGRALAAALLVFGSHGLKRPGIAQR